MWYDPRKLARTQAPGLKLLESEPALGTLILDRNSAAFEEYYSYGTISSTAVCIASFANGQSPKNRDLVHRLATYHRIDSFGRVIGPKSPVFESFWV